MEPFNPSYAHGAVAARTVTTQDNRSKAAATNAAGHPRYRRRVTTRNNQSQQRGGRGHAYKYKCGAQKSSVFHQLRSRTYDGQTRMV